MESDDAIFQLTQLAINNVANISVLLCDDVCDEMYGKVCLDLQECVWHYSQIMYIKYTYT